jgi:hypothetical protein
MEAHKFDPIAAAKCCDRETVAEEGDSGECRAAYELRTTREAKDQRLSAGRTKKHVLNVAISRDETTTSCGFYGEGSPALEKGDKFMDAACQ